jgi:hypothetical protein
LRSENKIIKLIKKGTVVESSNEIISSNEKHFDSNSPDRDTKYREVLSEEESNDLSPICSSPIVKH